MSGEEEFAEKAGPLLGPLARPLPAEVEAGEATLHQQVDVGEVGGAVVGGQHA